MINAFMIQLYIPLNFLGVLYREIKQSLTDLDKMFALLERNREVDDVPDAKPLQVSQGVVRFDDVSFAYEPARPILHGVSFEIPAGKTVAVVGPSGAGKSTLARLLYRFYDIGGGRISIDGQDIRQVTQPSLRQAIGIVPQDTVLFNDTVEYNIAYGRAGASRAEVEAAAQAAHIHHFIAAQPLGYDTMVGERGLKLSGRREAARGHRAHAAEEPADPDLRRSHLGAGFGQRACHPGRAAQRRTGQDRAGHRPPAEHGGRRPRDRGAGAGPRGRTRRPCRAAGARRALCADVAAAAEQRDGLNQRPCLRRRRITAAAHSKPAANIVAVAGSGTGVVSGML